MDAVTNEPGAGGANGEPIVVVAPDPAQRISELERDLGEAQRALRRTEARVQIHRALAGAGALDADAVALVVETAIPPAPSAEGPPDAAMIARAVEEVRRTRPALFRPAAPSRGPAMSAGVEPRGSRLEDAARHAARSGDRASLLHYLRLRRAP